MKLKISDITLMPCGRGKHNLLISRIGLYDDAGKWVKWVKLNDFTIKCLIEGEIEIKLNG